MCNVFMFKYFYLSLMFGDNCKKTNTNVSQLYAATKLSGNVPYCIT